MNYPILYFLKVIIRISLDFTLDIINKKGSFSKALPQKNLKLVPEY